MKNEFKLEEVLSLQGSFCYIGPVRSGIIIRTEKGLFVWKSEKLGGNNTISTCYESIEESHIFTPPSSDPIRRFIGENVILEQDDLMEQINNVVETMLDDITSGRSHENRHFWIEQALRGWLRGFLIEFSNLSEKMDRLKLVRERTTKRDLWENIDAELKYNVGESENFYNSFDILAHYFNTFFR